jgi:peroxiredoxin Q/BCP
MVPEKEKNMKSLQITDSIPSFSLPDQDGKIFRSDDFKGNKKMVIFFYPKDDSPGCTKEACYFRDLYEVFSEADALVIGISGQSPESHKKFALKHRLTYTLLSDMGNKVRKAFGVPSDLFGLLPGRVTYVVDRGGRIVHIFNSQMQTERHVDEALKILKELK